MPDRQHHRPAQGESDRAHQREDEAEIDLDQLLGGSVAAEFEHQVEHVAMGPAAAPLPALPLGRESEEEAEAPQPPLPAAGLRGIAVQDAVVDDPVEQLVEPARAMIAGQQRPGQSQHQPVSGPRPFADRTEAGDRGGEVGGPKMVLDHRPPLPPDLDLKRARPEHAGPGAEKVRMIGVEPALVAQDPARQPGVGDAELARPHPSDRPARGGEIVEPAERIRLEARPGAHLARTNINSIRIKSILVQTHSSIVPGCG
jgi:hypothetical protein